MTGFPAARTGRSLGALLLGVLFVLLAADFWSDVHERDAFTWMDPYQYYNFALDLIEGVRGYAQFELPSVFPFFVAPFLLVDASIPAALCVQLLFMLVFAVAIWRLTRSLAIEAPVAAVLAAVLSSPLLVGLSRSLYAEFALSAMVALHFAVWFDDLHWQRRSTATLFALLLALGMMMKMTYPLFMALPLVLAAITWVRAADWPALRRMALVVGLPVVVALGVQYFVFKESFAYYLSLGNTRIPIMYLIGPTQAFSLESFIYYWTQIGKTLLFLLTPLLLLLALPPVSRAFRDETGRRWRERPLLLGGWLVGPLVLLVPQAVKEPRHVAPVAAAGVLLIFWAISRLPSPKLRHILVGVVVVAAVGQYLAVTQHLQAAPYFVDRPARTEEVMEAMVSLHRQRGYPIDSLSGPNHLRWLFTRNIAVSGFPPNEALLHLWQFNPAVVYDLDAMLPGAFQGGRLAVDGRFEDLCFLTAFNAYNRRCGTHRYDATLDRQTVIDNADFILLAAHSPDEFTRRWPRYRLVMSLSTDGAQIHLLAAAAEPVATYRELYARQLLASGLAAAHGDSATIYFDLLINGILRADGEAVGRVMREFPLQRLTDREVRNIYWTSKTQRARTMALSLLEQSQRQRPGAGSDQGQP